MEFFRDTKIDFLGVKFWCIGLSALLVVAALLSMFTKGFVFGIDFRGGADVQLKFREAPDQGRLRAALNEAGFSGVTVQRMGSPEAHEILIRLDPGGDGTAEEGSAPEKEDIASDILNALRTPEDLAMTTGKLDLNAAGEAEIRAALAQGLGPGSEATAASAAKAVTAARNAGGGLLESVDQAVQADGIAPEAAAWLSENAVAGRFSIRAIDYVGPAVGKELRAKARWAVLMSLLAMLAYIAFRFHGTGYGVAAIVTLAHDVIITLGFISVLGKEFDLSVLAAVLTVVGYSVNDTIVIFDRVRDNMRLKRQADAETIFNSSINQCLSRTILTSLLVFVVLLSIWVFGGSRLEPFSFALLIGTVSGTYSTIYIASPTVIWWLNWTKSRQARARA